MKIVIISAYIYPMVSPRSFRATELAKELARLDHDVFLYALIGDYDYSDFEKDTGVKVRSLGRPITGALDSSGQGHFNIIDKVLYRLLEPILYYPHTELVWKVFSVIKSLSNIDVLITVAYPHPIHWGAALARKFLPKATFPRVFISDCGDPFYGNPIRKNRFIYFKWIEKFWGDQTDFITIPIDEAKSAYLANAQPKLRVIPQGFDFTKVEIQDYVKNSIPTFSYAGVIYPNQRDPTKFLQYLETLNFDFVFYVYTSSKKFYAPFKQTLGEKLVLRDYVPREELILQLSTMDFLINLTNPSVAQSPSKLIDYTLTKRPILDVGLSFSNAAVLHQFMEGDYSAATQLPNIDEYNIKNVAVKFLSLANEGRRHE